MSLRVEAIPVAA